MWAVVVALLMFSQPWIPVPSTRPTPTEFPECPKYFHSACSEALGQWLPSFGEAAEPWRHAKTTQIAERDGFMYSESKEAEKHSTWTTKFLGFHGPDDGTFFVYGNAGPPKGHVVFDYAHHIAFYEQGCCSWQEVIAAAEIAPPPKQVVERSLVDLHTARGIRLGMDPADVTKIYGASNLLPVAGRPDVKLLAYTTWKPFAEVTSVGAAFPGTCGQFENFYFRGDRLSLIQLGNGC